MTLLNSINRIQSYLPITLVIIITFIIIILAFIIYLIRSYRKPKAPKRPEDNFETADREKVAVNSIFTRREVKKSFSNTMKLLKSNIVDYNFKYKIPWVMVLGNSDTNKEIALKGSGQDLPLGETWTDSSNINSPCKWWLFRKGVVLDISGEYILEDNSKSSSDNWSYLLRLLQKYRQQRPIDGIVITVSAVSLMDSGEYFAADMNKLVERADLLYERVWKAGKVLGLRLPVYVIVTNSNKINGFTELCGNIPGKLSGNMFGWSNPYSVDTGYSTEWVSDAFQYIRKKLFNSQFQIFTSNTDIKSNSDVYLFNENISKMQKTTQAFIDRLFKRSVYRESFIFRGIYFCGTIEHNNKTYFLKDVFEKKIFPEFSLAQPLRKTLISRNRVVIALQICALLIVLCGLGVWKDAIRLHDNSFQMQNALREISQTVDSARNKLGVQARGSENISVETILETRDFYYTATEDILDDLTEINKIKYFFIPSSWWSGIHDKLTLTIKTVFNSIVSNGIFAKINNTASNIVDTETERFNSETNYLKQINLYLNRLGEVEKNSQLYKNLRKDNNAENLKLLLNTFFQIKHPVDFTEKDIYFKRALPEFTYREFDPATFMHKENLYENKIKQFKILVDYYYRSVFQNNELILSLDKLSRQLNIDYHNSLKQLFDSLVLVEKALTDSENSWIFEKDYIPETSMKQIIEEIKTSNFLGPDIALYVEDQGKRGFNKLKNRLLAYSSPGTDVILERVDKQPLNKLSMNVLLIKSSFEELSNQGLLSGKTKQYLFPTPKNHFTWNTSILNEALELVKKYMKYMEKKDAGMQALILRDTGSSLNNKIMELVRDAIDPSNIDEYFSTHSYSDDELYIGALIDNFKDANELVLNIAAFLEQLEFFDSSVKLSELLYVQASTLLGSINDIFDTEKFYGIDSNVDEWIGSSYPSWAAFNVSDEEELKYFLQSQKERINFIAFMYAQPIVDFFAKSKIARAYHDDRLLFRWEQIIKDLEENKTKKPDNSIGQLDKFILLEMNKFNDGLYYLEISPEIVNQKSSNYFLAIRDDLRKTMYTHSRKNALIYAKNLYGSIQNSFKEKLAGRFPFSDENEKTVVDPGDIKDFYLLLDQNKATIKKVLKENLNKISHIRIISFINYMEEIRNFFSLYLDDKKMRRYPSFGFAVEFRVNKKFEKGANRIIDWRMEVGNTVLNKRALKNEGIWKFGEPVKLSLRWAKDYDTSPVYNGNNNNIFVRDKVLTYQFQDKWAPIRMMKQYADEDADYRENLLRFDIDTNATNIPTTVFIKFYLTDPENKDKILFLPYFPEKAPNHIKF